MKVVFKIFLMCRTMVTRIGENAFRRECIVWNYRCVTIHECPYKGQQAVGQHTVNS